MTGKQREGHHQDLPLELESSIFYGLTYRFQDNHIIIMAGDNGMLFMGRTISEAFAREFLEVAKVWKGIRT